MRPFAWHAPETFEELFDLRQRLGEDAMLIGGGTALLIALKQGLVAPESLVSLHRLPLKEIAADERGGLRLGAMVPHGQAEHHPLVRTHAPVLAETLARVASVRVRTTATLGGNLAHADPAHDPPAALMALDATVVLRSARGTRTVPVSELFVGAYETVIGPDEAIEAVLVPPAPARSAAAFEKFTPRTDDDYGTVSVAVRLTLAEDGERCEDARIAASGIGAAPARFPAAEDALRGQRLEDAAIAAAAAQVSATCDPLDDLRGSADYKRAMAAEFTRRALARARVRAQEAAGV